MKLSKYMGSASLIAFAIGIASSAHAAVVIDVQEVDGNVVFMTSGSLDLTDATSLGNRGYQDGVISGGDNWYIASGDDSSVDNYAMTSFDGAFGTNTDFLNNPTTSSGDDFTIWGNAGDIEQVGVNTGYVSGTLFNSLLVYTGQTFASMGLTSGSYNYAIPSDTITLNIGAVSEVPLPASLPLLLAGLGGFGLIRRKRKAA